MYKLTFLIILLGSLISANASKNWTIALSSTKNLNNANYFIKKNIGKTKQDIFVFRVNNRYRVTLGAFDTYMDAKRFLSKQSKTIKRSKPYILKSRYNLHGKRIPNLVKLITTRKILQAKPKPKVQAKQVVKKEENKKAQEQKSIKVEKEKDNIKDALEQKEEVQEVDLSKKLKKKVLGSKKSNFELLASYAPTAMDGSINLFSKGEVNLENDLGLTDNANGFNVEVRTDYDTAKIYLGTIVSSNSGSNSLARDITLSNTTYTSGTNVDTSVDQRWFYVGYNNKYKGPFHYGVELYSYDNDIKISSATKSTNIENSYFFGSLNGFMRHQVDRFVLDYGLALGKGIDVDYKSYFLNINRDVSFIKNSNIQIGYKNRQIDIDEDNYTSDIEYEGFHFDFIKRF